MTPCEAHRRFAAEHPHFPGVRAPEGCPEEVATPPGLGTLAVTGMAALGRFLLGGAKRVSPKTLAARMAICAGLGGREACPQWNPKGWGGLGQCRKCGCSGIKLTWPAERCPLIPPKWGPEPPATP